MEQVPDKVLGNLLSSAEYNNGTNKELKNCITETGQSFSTTNLKQIVQAMNIKASNRSTLKEQAASTGSAYVVASYQNGVEPLQFLRPGAYFRLKITNANTSSTPTISFNGVSGTFNITNKDGSGIAINLFKTGDIISFVYDGANVLLENNNQIVNEKIINTSNIYVATSSTPNVYKLANLAANPDTYYDGLVVRFKAVTTNTGSVSFNINGLGDIPVVNSLSDLVAGDILADDLIEAVYLTGSSAKFYITKQTSPTRLNASNQVVAKDNTNTSHVIAGINNGGMDFVDTPSLYTRTLKQKNDKGHTTLSASYKDVVIQLSPIASYSTTFLYTMYAYEPIPFKITFKAAPGEVFTRNGVDHTEYTLNLTTYSNAIFTLSFLSLSRGLMLSGNDGATEGVQGLARIATQAQVNAGTDDQAYVTSKTLEDKGTFVGLDAVYPIGSDYFNSKSNFSIANLPGAVAGFVWTPIPDDCVVQTTTSASSVGLVAGESATSGSTQGHLVTTAEIEEHTHFIARKEENYGNAGVTRGETGRSVIDWMDAPSPGGNSYILASSKLPGATANVGLTSKSGGGQEHSHKLGLQTYRTRGWTRTA